MKEISSLDRVLKTHGWRLVFHDSKKWKPVDTSFADYVKKQPVIKIGLWYADSDSPKAVYVREFFPSNAKESVKDYLAQPIRKIGTFNALEGLLEEWEAAYA